MNNSALTFLTARRLLALAYVELLISAADSPSQQLPWPSAENLWQDLNQQKGNFMKTWKLPALTLTLTALGTQWSPAPVGYINRTIQPGYNLVADQLIQSPDNSINSVLIGTTPNGATFTKWSGNAFLPLSTYNASTLTWSINYTLNLGEGGYLYTPTLFINTFLGEVAYYPPLGTNVWSPNYGPGLHLVSSPMPIAGSLSTMFSSVVGRAPVDGESVWLLNELTQQYNHSTYDGSAWDLNANLAVGQAAWIDIGGTGQSPPLIPEPTTAALVLLAAGTALAHPLRRLRTRG